ncbi:MAG: hypothetical protein J0I77_13545 [Rudaea sp.]|uniref:hypothetical protein n=1 Tax=unclassified Rudaea TaxID=2627037 RepID=UPI0010FA20DF|nr:MULTISPECIES: hypothetical protein [unclassified Rudaea]MBN8886740.1 hypothetical protein [Rudaea sp.]MBR0344949.1 hypothetical protein [Rudaea sp.]
MTRHSFVRLSVPTLIVATAFLSGCGWFHRDRVDYYKSAQESRPLEVPPDLDAPATTRELVVPGSAPRAASAGGAAASSVSSVPPSVTGGAASGATDLHVVDAVDNAYQRVGLALERAQLGKVASKDDASRSYAFDFDGAITTKPAQPQEHHWYSRILHPFGGGGDKAETQNVKASLRVNVSEDAGGSRVSVVPAPGDKSGEAAAQRVLAVLRERLS